MDKSEFVCINRNPEVITTGYPNQRIIRCNFSRISVVLTNRSEISFGDLRTQSGKTKLAASFFKSYAPKRRGTTNPKIFEHNRSNIIILVPFILIIALFCSQQRAVWKGTIYEENGVRVIKNPKKPIYGGNVFEIKEELSIGDAKGREEYQFSRVSGIAVDKEERIYVLDYKEAHIKVFNKNGNYHKTLGGKGQGPGEFSAPFSICITNQNEIMVQDLNNRRIIFLSLDGTYLKSHSTAKIIIVGTRIDSKGNIIGIVSSSGPEKQLIELKKFDSRFSDLVSFGSYFLPRGSLTFNPFMPEFRWTLNTEDYVICGHSEKYELKIFAPEGKLKKIIIKEYKPVEITREEIEKRKKTLPGPMILNIPRYHSAYQDLTVDEEGRIFVQTWEMTKDGQSYNYDIFDPEGRYIAKIPLRSRPWIWKKNALYSIEENKEGFQVVKRYKVKWNI